MGDKIGFKPILLTSVIGYGICATFIDLTPRYKEYERHPSALLSRNDNEKGAFTLMEITWPLSSPKCDVTKSAEIMLCEESPLYNTNEFYEDLINYLSCENRDGDAAAVDRLDVSLFNTPSNNNLSIKDLPSNGTYCKLTANKLENNTTENLICDIMTNPDVGNCLNDEGAHLITFFVYLLLRTPLRIFENNIFNLMDGTSMHLFKQQKSDYAWLYFWNTVGNMFGPMISGALVEDSNDPSSKKTFYLALLLSLWLKTLMIYQIIIQSLNYSKNLLYAHKTSQKFLFGLQLKSITSWRIM